MNAAFRPRRHCSYDCRSSRPTFSLHNRSRLFEEKRQSSRRQVRFYRYPMGGLDEQASSAAWLFRRDAAVVEKQAGGISLFRRGWLASVWGRVPCV